MFNEDKFIWEVTGGRSTPPKKGVIEKMLKFLRNLFKAFLAVLILNSCASTTEFQKGGERSYKVTKRGMK